MAKPSQGIDPGDARIDELRQSIAGALERATNSTNTLKSELQALHSVLPRVQKWRGKLQDNTKNLVDLAVTRLREPIKALPGLPEHGAELEARASQLRASMAAALAQFALLGVSIVERDEAALEAMKNDLEATLAKHRQSHDSLVAEIKKSSEVAREAADSAQNSARKVGITVNMTAFSIAAAGHARAALGWAIAAGAIATILFLAAAHSMLRGSGPPISDGSWYVAANLSHYLARALTVTLGSFLLVFCARNFRSERHNEVVNRHRAGALATHDTLRTTGNNRVDDAVSLHVAEAVFASQPSGYAETDTNGTHVTELISALKDLRP